MAVINLPAAVSSPSQGASLPGKVSSPATSFSLGEQLSALILDKAGAGRFLLALKNQNISAESSLPLNRGEKLTLRVEQLIPQLVLRIVSRGDDPSAPGNAYLLRHRANPTALADIFNLGRLLSGEKQLLELLPKALQEQLLSVIKAMNSLVLSPENLKNPLFLKEYLTNLGLLLECDLLKVLRGKKDAKDLPSSGGLKGAMMQLSARLQELLKNGALAGTEKEQKAMQLAEFARSSAETIETHQMLNILAQKNGNTYLLTIPMLFPDGVRMGEIFVEIEEGKTGRGGKNYRLTLFLDMDALGEMMVEASLKGKKLNCNFAFADPGSQIFFSGFLPKLADAVNLLGYECDYLNCLVREDLSGVRNERHQAMFAGQDAVNLYA